MCRVKRPGIVLHAGSQPVVAATLSKLAVAHSRDTPQRCVYAPLFFASRLFRARIGIVYFRVVLDRYKHIKPTVIVSESGQVGVLFILMNESDNVDCH